MKIAIIHDYLTKAGGAEKVLRHFCSLFPKAPVYTLLHDPAFTEKFFGKTKPQIFASYLNDYLKILRRKSLLVNKFPAAIESFDLSNYDVVVSFSNSFAHGVLTKPSTLHICYSYSPTRFLWDWTQEYKNEHHLNSVLTGWYAAKALSDLRLWDRLAAERPDLWLTQSTTAAKRLKKYYKVDSTIIHPPVDVLDIPLSGKGPEDYFLIISRLEPYKKIDLAIEAFNTSGRPLTIIGEGSDFRRLKSIAKKNIQLLGWKSDEQLRYYLTKSYALIFPGEEDFGLTPIEAMAAGRPVVAFNQGGVTETVIGGKTGVFFDQPTPESLLEAVNQLDENYHTFEPEACRQRALEFSAEAFKERISQYISQEYEKKMNGK